MKSTHLEFLLRVSDWKLSVNSGGVKLKVLGAINGPGVSLALALGP